MAHLALIREKCLVALDAVRVFFLEDVLLTKQGLLTLRTVIAVGHFDLNLLSESSEQEDRIKRY